MIVLLKFLLAHLIGDFFLQTGPMVKAKEEKKLAAWQLYAHSLAHGALVLLFMWDWRFLKWALLIALVHFIIDSIKLLTQNVHNRRALFFIDQALHFISLFFIWLWYEDKSISLSVFMNERFLFLAAALIFLTTPVSFAVKTFISKWTPHTGDNADGSLQSAGKNIGIIERLLIFIFIVINQWQAVGFLLAAKSIFRFGDLKESKDRKLTEYILIGTLASFGIAIVTGIAYELCKNCFTS
jgi:hypothetical protein